MEHERLPVPQDAPALSLYDDALARAGHIADAALGYQSFEQYQAGIADNTKRRQRNDLALFSQFLADAGIQRSPEALYTDPEAWRGMSYGLLKGFQSWLLQRSYSTGAITVATMTIRQYCKLAGPEPEGAGVIEREILAMIQTIGGISGTRANNIDQDRQRVGLKTRKGAKKAMPTAINPAQAMKFVETSVAKPTRRKHDELLEARDLLLAALLVEHALRCSEVALLDIASINLAEDTMLVYRKKTHEHDQQALKAHTRQAALDYLSHLEAHGITSGPLFQGYRGKRLSTRAINERVAQIGREMGVAGRLSPHDLRHFWTWYALKKKTPIDRVKRGGGWKSNEMVLRYAENIGIANEGVIVIGEEEQ
jgi:integrase